MMRYFLMAMLMFSALPGWGFCPYSDRLLGSLDPKAVLQLRENCAISMNDDVSQVYLARAYENGTDGVEKDIKKAFYYYQLSSDNGNAESQTHLAELYRQYDQSPTSRKVLKDYTDSIQPMIRPDENVPDDFKGELLHPYVLLLLASERAENKWYYPTNVLVAPPVAKQLLAGYKIDNEKKKALMRQATAWKKRKLLEIARQLLPGVEYMKFSKTLYPTEGQGDAFARKQALDAFKQKVLERKQQDETSAKAFY